MVTRSLPSAQSLNESKKGRNGRDPRIDNLRNVKVLTSGGTGVPWSFVCSMCQVCVGEVCIVAVSLVSSRTVPGFGQDTGLVPA